MNSSSSESGDNNSVACVVCDYEFSPEDEPLCPNCASYVPEAFQVIVKRGRTDTPMTINNNEQGRQPARTSRQVMPDTTTCPNCGLTYYQTAAPHVCAEWTRGKAKEEQAMSHQRNASGNCSISGCPCRGWSAQESATEHEHAPPARAGESGRFTISVHQNGYYCVSIPSYHGGEVVKVEEYERLQEALRVIRDSFWSENEPYSERVEHLQQLARQALNEQGKEHER